MFKHGPEALVSDLAFWSQGLTNPQYPLDQLGRLSREVSDKFRALAIMQLLTQKNTDLFLHNLMRSGRARKTYLERMKAAGVEDDYDQASGRLPPLWAAIAANDLVLARSITELAPQSYRAGGYEYEDDYCYAQLLRLLLAEHEVPTQEFAALFERFERLLNEGETNARLAVCRALHLRQQTAFDQAFDDLLQDFEQSINKKHGQHVTDCVIADRQICIEALAILRVAQRQGLDTATEYRYCPTSTRAPMRQPFPAI